MSSDRKWGLRHLLAGWGAYWSVLAVTTLATPLTLLWHVTRQPNDTASASVGFTNDVLNASITSYGKTVWSGSASLFSLVFWIAGPPLLMWVAWLVTRSRASADEAPSAMKAGNANVQLPPSPPAFTHPDRFREHPAVGTSRPENRHP